MIIRKLFVSSSSLLNLKTKGYYNNYPKDIDIPNIPKKYNTYNAYEINQELIELINLQEKNMTDLKKQLVTQKKEIEKISKNILNTLDNIYIIQLGTFCLYLLNYMF